MVCLNQLNVELIEMRFRLDFEEYRHDDKHIIPLKDW